jgi:hypothetical protein
MTFSMIFGSRAEATHLGHIVEFPGFRACALHPGYIVELPGLRTSCSIQATLLNSLDCVLRAPSRLHFFNSR